LEKGVKVFSTKREQITPNCCVEELNASELKSKNLSINIVKASPPALSQEHMLRFWVDITERGSFADPD
jgi:hypothetical protein